MEFQTTRKVLKNLSPISLADIVFLLLIFFLLSSTFVMQPGIKVKLPKADIMAMPEPEDNITITLSEEQGLFLDGKPIKMEDLAISIQTRLNEGANPYVIIMSDKIIAIESVVEVMDKAKSVGIEKFLIATQQPSIAAGGE